jgi:hypothetical protein
MDIFDRFREARPLPEVDRCAVPLTPGQVAQLVEALYEVDRLRGVHRPDISGPGWGADDARAVSTAAGVAAALGFATVPVPASNLRSYDLHLEHMARWAPSSASTQQFRLLLTELHALEGVARIKGWTARWKEPGGYQWDNPPAGPAAAESTVAQIPAASAHGTSLGGALAEHLSAKDRRDLADYLSVGLDVRDPRAPLIRRVRDALEESPAGQRDAAGDVTW